MEPDFRGRPLVLAVHATRPAFLSVTLSAYLLGLAAAAHDGVRVDALLALAGLIAVVLAHAAGNVWNDVADAANGTDRLNQERVAPFTGGSRVIDRGLMDRAGMARLAIGLCLLAVLLAAPLIWQQPLVLPVALAGALLAWAYSAPPLWLVARGLGELTIAATWLLVTLGADLLQRGMLSMMPVAVGAGHALLVAAILYINQFPDAAADAAVGKRTLVVRLGARRAVGGFLLLHLLAAGLLLAGVRQGALPPWAALTLLSLLPGLTAGWILSNRWSRPAKLAPAIRLTIVATLLHGAVLAAVLILAG